jgi:membrane protein DedA with SNARE-associated domain
VSGIVGGLLNVPSTVAYAVIALLVFGEAALFVGFVLPGETAVLLGGVMAATGKLSLTAVLVVVVVAAVVGDSVGYEVGRQVGPRLLRTRAMRRHSDRLDGARRVLRERGGWAVLLGRFTAFLRAVMPGMAGLSRMPYGRFLVFNALGGLLWGSGVVLLGYFAGGSYAKVESTLGRSTTAAAVVVLAAGLVWWRVRARRQRGENARRRQRQEEEQV